VAKLKLLEHGLLDAAQGLDDIHIRVRRRKDKTKVPDRADVVNNDDSGDDESAFPDESQQDFIQRINIYVTLHLGRASSSTRDSYKDGLVFQAKKDITNEFLKSTLLKKCQNSDCGW